MRPPRAFWADMIGPAALACAVTLAHLLTNNRYGVHRDELQVLSDALHLDWGFVVYPPFTPLMERIGLSMFGVSLVGLRLFSVLAQAAVLIITALMARELNGGRLAQFTASLAVAVSALPMFEGTEFQYTTFDYLWWVLIAYFVIRLLKSEDPRWCLAIGACVGLGLMTKYTMVFYLGGILAGLLLTSARKFLRSRWFWAGAALAFLIFLPNLIWQIRHDFVSYQFLHHIHVRDVSEGRARGFWRDQFLHCVNRFAAPLWIAGLFGFLLSRRYRMLAWMYIVPVLVLWLAKGRGYYAGAVYPMLLAFGAVLFEHGLKRLPRIGRVAIASVYLIALAAWGAYISTGIIPWASSGPLRARALENNGDLREEIGWDELVKTVAGIRDSLAETQQNVGIIVGNYGEQGAVEILGRAYRYHLPPPISGTNSAWYRSYPVTPPSALIVLGFSREQADRAFTGCRLAGHNGNSEGVHNEESDDHPDIFVCAAPRLPWPEFWKEFRRFG
jgi:hypothetical protein